MTNAALGGRALAGFVSAPSFAGPDRERMVSSPAKPNEPAREWGNPNEPERCGSERTRGDAAFQTNLSV